MRRNVQGIALVTALAILAIVTLLVAGTIFTTQIEAWTTRNDTTSTQAYYIAHAGLEKFKTVTFQTFGFYLDNLQQYGDSLGTSAICGNLLASGLDLNRNFIISAADGDLMPGGSVTRSYAGGSYTVTFSVSGPDIVLTSEGRINRARATVQVVFHPQNAGLFSNALFAGGGISSKFINGGAQVWGSVYVQGPTPDPTGTPPTVISSNGNFGMHNFYDTNELLNLMGNQFTEQQLQQMLGSTATDQKDLCARLRVAYGQVSAGGTTTLGDSTAPTDYKATLAGLNVTGGSSDISISGSTSVYADNYPNGALAYDLSKTMQLPTLDGTTCKSDPTKSWRQCMQTGSQASSFPNDAGKNGNCDLAALTDASTSTIVFSDVPIDCTYQDANGLMHGFSYTQDSYGNWNLEVHGVVNFAGYNVHFERNVATRFANKATIMASTDSGVGGDITIDGDILPSTTQLCDSNGNCKTPRFPSDEVLGMIADHDLTFTGATQVSSSSKTQTSVGLFYAGNEASIEKGSVVMGTVMANGISTSQGPAGQTSKVLQVPGLEYNLAPGFTEIPGDLTATFAIKSYERR